MTTTDATANIPGVIYSRPIRCFVGYWGNRVKYITVSGSRMYREKP